MVIFWIIALLPVFCFSAEFTASVNRNQIPLKEGFVLNLALKGTSTTETPSIESLKPLFVIHSQKQGFNTVSINGHVTSEILWQFTLIPQKEGKISIPAISLLTNEGVLSTTPIQIVVLPSVNPAPEVALNVDVSNESPYKTEPILYTIKMISPHDLANIQMQKIQLENAIIEPVSEPKIERKIIEGVRTNVIELKYIVTPLKTGAVTIPSIAIQGDVPVKRNGSRDIFSMIQGFEMLKPFALTSVETTLEVQAPVEGITPWLVAHSLKIEELESDTTSFEEGVPFTRSFKITGEGIRGQQLPTDLLKSNKDFKIYADKPEWGDEVQEGKILSFRKEQYTLIPQHSKDLILPEISIDWWNSQENKKETSFIPSRTLSILPAAIIRSKVLPETVVTQNNPLLYALIGAIGLLFCCALTWGIFLQRKIGRLQPVVKENKTPIAKIKHVKEKKENLPDLNPT